MGDASTEDLERRRDARRRNRRVVSGVVAFTVAALGTFAAFTAFRDSGADPGPAETPPSAAASRVPPPSSTFQFVDQEHGWVVVAGRLLGTTDGGKSWSVQTTGDELVEEVQFIDRFRGWAVLRDNGLLQTRDGGVHWIVPGGARPPITDGPIPEHVHFVDGSFGWGIDRDAPQGDQVVRTLDGGVLWHEVGRPYKTIDSICFPKVATGWAVSGPTVFRTNTSGNSWVAIALDVPGEPSTWQAVLRCSSERDAWIELVNSGAAGTVPYVVFHSDDGGGTWVPELQERSTSPLREDGIFASEDPYPGPFDVPSSNAAFLLNFCPACGEVSALTRTLDGGATWGRIDPKQDLRGEPIGLSFIDQTNGWATLIGPPASDPTEATNILVLKTSDGGETWARVGAVRYAS